MARRMGSCRASRWRPGCAHGWDRAAAEGHFQRGSRNDACVWSSRSRCSPHPRTPRPEKACQLCQAPNIHPSPPWCTVLDIPVALQHTGNWHGGLPQPPAPRSLPLWCGLQLPLAGERAAAQLHGCREVLGARDAAALITSHTVWKVRISCCF